MKNSGARVFRSGPRLLCCTPPARVYQKALFDAGIPANALITSDIAADVARLKARGVVFRGEPTLMGPITAVMFEDTCGNLIQLVQPHV